MKTYLTKIGNFLAIPAFILLVVLIVGGTVTGIIKYDNHLNKEAYTTWKHECVLGYHGRVVEKVCFKGTNAVGPNYVNPR